MTMQEAADRADVIVAGYAYTVQDGYIEVLDLNDLSKRAVIQNGDVVESLMSDEEDDMVLRYYSDKENRKGQKDSIWYSKIALNCLFQNRFSIQDQG